MITMFKAHGGYRMNVRDNSTGVVTAIGDRRVRKEGGSSVRRRDF